MLHNRPSLIRREPTGRCCQLAANGHGIIACCQITQYPTQWVSHPFTVAQNTHHPAANRRVGMPQKVLGMFKIDPFTGMQAPQRSQFGRCGRGRCVVLERSRSSRVSFFVPEFKVNQLRNNGIAAGSFRLASSTLARVAYQAFGCRNSSTN